MHVQRRASRREGSPERGIVSGNERKWLIFPIFPRHLRAEFSVFSVVPTRGVFRVFRGTKKATQRVQPQRCMRRTQGVERAVCEDPEGKTQRVIQHKGYNIMYSDRARELRRCQAERKDGTSCQGWAVWGDEQGRCAGHGGRVAGRHVLERTHYTPCRCIAYAWPHRPGSGLCKWPDMPEYRSTLPAGTHALGYKELRRFLRQPSPIAAWRFFH